MTPNLPALSPAQVIADRYNVVGDLFGKYTLGAGVCKPRHHRMAELDGAPAAVAEAIKKAGEANQAGEAARKRKCKNQELNKNCFSAAELVARSITPEVFALAKRL